MVSQEFPPWRPELRQPPEPVRKITASDVSACLVTRGDTDLDPIIATLPYDDIVIWNNAENERDLKVYGRFAAANFAKHDVVYFQDDDCIFEHHEELLAAYEPGKIVANWGHGSNAAGFDDLPLVCGGGIVDRELPAQAFERYLQHFPMDEGFLYEADFICGILTPFKHVFLPFEILPLATHPTRLANQPWQREMKMKMTNQARWIRDHVIGPPRTDSMPIPTDERCESVLIYESA